MMVERNDGAMTPKLGFFEEVGEDGNEKVKTGDCQPGGFRVVCQSTEKCAYCFIVGKAAVAGLRTGAHCCCFSPWELHYTNCTDY